MPIVHDPKTGRFIATYNNGYAGEAKTNVGRKASQSLRARTFEGLSYRGVHIKRQNAGYSADPTAPHGGFTATIPAIQLPGGWSSKRTEFSTPLNGAAGLVAMRSQIQGHLSKVRRGVEAERGAISKGISGFDVPKVSAPKVSAPKVSAPKVSAPKMGKLHTSNLKKAAPFSSAAAAIAAAPAGHTVTPLQTKTGFVGMLRKEGKVLGYLGAR